MNPHLPSLLALTDDVMAGRPLRSATGTFGSNGHYRGPVHVGVDLGTAYTVLAVWYQDAQDKLKA